MENQNELTHHGVLGQRWGVRRYQNKDGTLTKAGQRRYKTSSDNPLDITDPKGIKRRLNDVDQGRVYNEFDAKQTLCKAVIANDYAQKKLRKNPDMDLNKHKWVKNRIDNARKWSVEGVEFMQYAAKGREELETLSKRFEDTYGKEYNLLKMPVDRIAYVSGGGNYYTTYYRPGTKYKIEKK